MEARSVERAPVARSRQVKSSQVLFVTRGKLTGIRIHSAGVKSQTAECASDVCCNALYSEDSILTHQDVHVALTVVGGCSPQHGSSR